MLRGSTVAEEQAAGSVILGLELWLEVEGAQWGKEMLEPRLLSGWVGGMGRTSE